MRNTLKIAISLPKEYFYKLEHIRKEIGLMTYLMFQKPPKISFLLYSILDIIPSWLIKIRR